MEELILEIIAMLNLPATEHEDLFNWLHENDDGSPIDVLADRFDMQRPEMNKGD